MAGATPSPALRDPVSSRPAPGRSRRPNWAKNRGVAALSVGRPTSRINPASSSASMLPCGSDTPRTASIPGRVTGWCRPTRASNLNVTRSKRRGASARRSRSASSDAVRNAYAPSASASTTPHQAQRACKVSSTRWAFWPGGSSGARVRAVIGWRLAKT